MKIKEYWKYIKEAWKDSRKKAIIKLSLYFVFFIVVIAMIRGNNTNNAINNDIENNNYNNYNFNLNYNGNEILNGTYDNDTVKYIYQNQVYYLNKGMTYQLINNELVNINNNHIHIDRLLINNLEDYIDESMETYRTEFSDGKIKKGYEIKIEDFAYLYENKEIIDNNKVNIGVTYLENQIVEIEYDLTQYFKNYYHNENDYIIKIVFSNFNLAEQLNLNFSK